MEGEAPKTKRNTSYRRKLNRSVSQRAENDRSRGNDKGDDKLRQRTSLFDIPNWSEVLGHLRGGALQAIMLNDLNELLSYATEDLLFGFDCPSFLQTLSQLLQQPQEDFNSPDLAPMHVDPNFQMACSDCIHMILDIFPEESKFFDSNPKNFGFITSMLAQLEYVDLGEKLLAIIDKISKECPKVLITSNVIPNILKYIDFYPIATQILALETISRALSAVSSISNYDEYVKPSLLPITQFMLHQNERIRESSLLCFKCLASNNMINDINVTIPYLVFHKMKELLDTEVAIANTLHNHGDFKISKSVLDVVDISAAFISSSNCSAVRNAEHSGLVESIAKLFGIFVPKNYRATNLFAITRLLRFLDDLISTTTTSSAVSCNQKILNHFSRETIKQLLGVTKCSMIKSFEHVNKWLNLDDCMYDFSKYTAIKLPINCMNKQIQLELVAKGETTRLLSHPFVPFSRIVSYILKNEQVNLPFQLSLNDSKHPNPIVVTIDTEEHKSLLLEVLLRVTKGKTIEDIWQTPHVLEVIYPFDYKQADNCCFMDCRIKRLFTNGRDRYDKFDPQYELFKLSIKKFITEGAAIGERENDLFDKLMKDNTKLSVFTPQQVEMLVINELADTAMLGVQPWIIDAVSMKPEAFSLPLRRLLFYLEASNLSRSIAYIQNIIKTSLDTRLIVSNRENGSSITSALASFEMRLLRHYHHTLSASSNKAFSDNAECRLTDRVKVNLDRNNLLRGAAEAFRQINFDTQPIIEFCLVDENGIGTGPTLEVYNLILEQLRDLSETIVPLFSPQTSNGYFPSPLNQDVFTVVDEDVLPFFDTTLGDYGEVDSVNNYKRLVFGWWYFIGQLVACAMIDQRPLDIRLSPLFWSLVMTDNDVTTIPFTRVYNVKSAGICINNGITKYHPLKILSLLDYEMARSLANLQILTPKHLNEYLTDRGYKDLDSYYKDIVSDHFDKYSVSIFAFRKGYSTVLPLYALNLFNSDELSDWWNNDYIRFDLNEARNYIMADHGYTQDSKPFVWLLEVLSELSCDEIRLFLKFCTGSPILPHGGFKNLKPLMCVVKKPIESNQPCVLPSVMTCTNYLKLPDYPTKEMLKKMLLYAINEGQNEFELS